MNFTKEQITKWLLIGISAFVGLQFVVPILITMTLDLITLAVLGIIALGIFFLLPSVCEALSLLGWRTWEMVIRADPLSRLKKDYAAFVSGVEQLENKISEGNAETIKMEKLFNQNKPLMTPEQAKEWEESLSLAKQAGIELVVLRNEKIKELGDFKLVIQRAEVDFKMGGAFKSALKAFSFAHKTGPKSVGAGVALDEVHKRLAKSQSQLALVLSRPTFGKLLERN